MPRPVLQLAGKVFGRLVAQRDMGPSSHGRLWRCYCDPAHGGCGGSTTAEAARLTSGRLKSCGCQARGNAAKRKVAPAR